MKTAKGKITVSDLNKDVDNYFKKQDQRTRLFLSFASLGVILFIFFTTVSPFGNGLFSLLFPKPASHAASATDWPQFQYNPQHTGRTTVQVNPNYQATWVWLDKTHIIKNFVSASGKSITDGLADKATFKSNVIFAGQMQPIVANGKTIFGSMNGTVYAVNALTGDNLWDFTTGGAILSTVADDQAVVVVPSMDGKLYGLNEADGTQKWVFPTGAGISAAPVIMNGTVYIGSRDGSFYAVDLINGTQKWKYDVRDPNGTFNKSPNIAPAAVSVDGATVVFGSENMYFYALNTTNGGEKWAPKKLVGQSFLYSWPVITGNNVVVRTMSSLTGAEDAGIPAVETLLAGLSANPDWQTEEKPAIQTYLTQNPDQKTMYTFDITTGNEPYQVAMGRVSGENFTPFPPVVDSLGRPLMYWRSKAATFLQGGPCFGTNFCPDISAMDPATGDRVKLSPTSRASIAPELDNGFALTIGGNYLYMENHFRGTIAINMTSGATTRITHSLSVQDCGNFRGYPYQIIYYGNDGGTYQTGTCTLVVDPVPSQVYHGSTSWTGMSIAQTGTTGMLYTNENNVNAITGISGGH